MSKQQHVVSLGHFMWPVGFLIWMVWMSVGSVSYIQKVFFFSGGHIATRSLGSPTTLKILTRWWHDLQGTTHPALRSNWCYACSVSTKKLCNYFSYWHDLTNTKQRAPSNTIIDHFTPHRILCGRVSGACSCMPVGTVGTMNAWFFFFNLTLGIHQKWRKRTEVDIGWSQCAQQLKKV